ncbi:MAG: SDR family oxidoreductase, partial [Clostridiales bacterium]|nr:SDR family oxidoreductase [Clostridiales bacterium]
SRSRNEIDEVVQEVEALGSGVLGLPFDLTVLENVNRLVDMTMQKFGSMDILVNNAGILVQKPFFEITPEDLDISLGINLRSMFILSQKVFKIMKEKRNGYVINISSNVALDVEVPKDIAATLSAYGISKCGVIGLSQSLCHEAQKYGVKISTIYPGVTDTKMVRDANGSENAHKWMLPEDIAECILFLLKSSDRMIIKDLVPLAFKNG